MNNEPNSSTRYLLWTIFLLLSLNLLVFWNIFVEPFPIIAEYIGKYSADKVFELAHKKQVQPNNSYSWRNEYILAWHIQTEIGKENIYITFSKPELRALLKSDEQYSNLAQNIIDRWNKE